MLTQPAREAARQHMMQITVCDWGFLRGFDFTPASSLMSDALCIFVTFVKCFLSDSPLDTTKLLQADSNQCVETS